MGQFIRTELLIGPEGLARLQAARVAVFGLGGVGGNAAEALARSGVGALDLFDDDTVSLSNLNRQLVATHDTVGQPKVDALAARLRSIVPAAKITPHRLFYLPELADEVDLSVFDYIVDAIDTVTAKLDLITRAHALGVPIVSAMGAGNRLDPTCLRVGDIYKTEGCALARVMRRELRRRGVPSLTVVYSTETPLKPRESLESPAPTRRDVPGSMAFVPPAMGLAMASVVVRALIGIRNS
ncbi:MAG: tRNA threonylcarbamoyladenosine dehydratase [Clostridia bacterium]|nr:tRNA threonylcarbamoyladenosine dehydratase [Clostridia bacterium]